MYFIKGMYGIKTRKNAPVTNFILVFINLGIEKMSN